MEFFDKLGKKASEAYKITADKTGKLAKETKMKLKIGELRTQVADIYEQIGEKVYEKHVREEEISIKEDLDEECTKIDVLSNEIDSLLKQCLALKDKKQCQKCYKEIEKDNNFCPNCGAKQSDKPAKEVEILENLKNTEVEEEKESEKQIVMEELENDIKEKEGQQNQEQQNEENQNNENNDEEKTDLEKTVEIESDINLEDEDEEKEDEEEDEEDDEQDN